MPSAEEYRRNAEECGRLADQTSDEIERGSLLKLGANGTAWMICRHATLVETIKTRMGSLPVMRETGIENSAERSSNQPAMQRELL